MRSCCEKEARAHVKRHRDVAVCDGCGRLVLGYGNEEEWKKTTAELARHGIVFESAKVGKIFVVAKERAPVGAGNGGDDDDDVDDSGDESESESESEDDDEG